MSRAEKILEFMQREGPVLPNKVARFLGTDMIIAGAHLSEMSSRKVVLITYLKVGGGSPIYYLPGDEEKLMRFYDELNGKDKVTFDLLKERKILRDKDLDALTRVSLRNIKDFAKPLQVDMGGGKEIFWKWYLIKNEEVSELIKGLLKPKVLPKPEPVKEEPKPEPIVKEKVIEKKPEILEKPKPEVKKEPEPVKEVLKPKPGIKKPEPVERQVVLEKEIVKPKPETQRGKPLVSQKPKVSEIKSDFYEKIKNYLDLKNIKIVESEVLRKTEINLMLGVPTAVGEIIYYAKAKSKKKCNDKDVSSAFLEGQVKKLPVLFLYSGEVTKKTEEMLQQDIFKNLILLHLD